MLIIQTFILFILTVTSFGMDAGRILRGRVEKVIDGDSLIVREGKRKYEVRLWGIDCPEYGQPYGANAQKLSKALLLNKNAQVVVRTRDSYGRYVGVVYQGNLNVNEELVRRGAAWVYKHYCRESICDEWKSLESKARFEQRGLWKVKKQVAPWQWRRDTH
ncbi:thermonuclease family protein [Desulfopila aestuarii]|uniref:Endonuclease YncB, thermonuclease family n=1 Tax=Desulfopila aestuarii DSM 18488 TaxID=1121416 RepID=A0A1M7YDH6_9BACT|nr:thermonuclease family protein [Desulfopila aestuarii]SHO50692.1 Endonuclease YncB, thermonuclease family [Desulfopila aestuarii DSM 18488]